MSKNPRITRKERDLLKGSIRRVFSQSSLRRNAMIGAQTTHSDPSRARVRTWYKCTQCKNNFAGYQMQVDHKDPVVPLNIAAEDMSWDTMIDRTWCDPNNLEPLCKMCHSVKTKVENKKRRVNKGAKR